MQLGSQGTGNGQFISPHSLAIDNFGNIYVGDIGNKRIQKFYPNGTFITKWGYEGTGGRDALRAPHQIVLNSIGTVYLTDRDGNQILKFHDNGTYTGTIGSKGSEPGQLNGPHGIAIDSDDNIYLTDVEKF